MFHTRAGLYYLFYARLDAFCFPFFLVIVFVLDHGAGIATLLKRSEKSGSTLERVQTIFIQARSCKRLFDPSANTIKVYLPWRLELAHGCSISERFVRGILLPISVHNSAMSTGIPISTVPAMGYVSMVCARATPRGQARPARFRCARIIAPIAMGRAIATERAITATAHMVSMVSRPRFGTFWGKLCTIGGGIIKGRSLR